MERTAERDRADRGIGRVPVSAVKTFHRRYEVRVAAQSAETAVEGLEGNAGNVLESGKNTSWYNADGSMNYPPNIDPSIYQEFVVVKEILNTVQAEIAAWGNSPGGGLQYELPMSIKQLIKEEYIVPK